MSYIGHALTYVLWGAPVWAYLALGGFMLINEVVRASKLESNSTVQLFLGLLGRGVGLLRRRFPTLPDEEPKLQAKPVADEEPKLQAAPVADEESPKRNGGFVELVVLLAVALAALLGLGAALTLAGCATSSQVTALRADAAAAHSLAASYNQWRSFDLAHQLQIVEASKDETQVKASLASWRSTRNEVNKAFEDARDALNLYHQAVMAGSGEAQAKEWSVLLGRVVTAFAAVASILNRYGIHLPAPVAAPPTASIDQAYAADEPAPCLDEERERSCPLILMPEAA